MWRFYENLLLIGDFLVFAKLRKSPGKVLDFYVGLMDSDGVQTFLSEVSKRLSKHYHYVDKNILTLSLFSDDIYMLR